MMSSPSSNRQPKPAKLVKRVQKIRSNTTRGEQQLWKRQRQPSPRTERRPGTTLFNPLIDTGANIIIDGAKAQAEKWRKMMDNIDKIVKASRFDLSEPEILEELSSIQTWALPIEERNIKIRPRLWAVMHIIFTNVNFSEIKSMMHQEALNFFDPRKKVKYQNHLEACEEVERSKIALVLSDNKDLQLWKQLYAHMADSTAAKLKINWLETAEEEWKSNTKLPEVLATLTFKHRGFPISSSQLIYYLSRFTAGYFVALKVEYCTAKDRIKKNLATAKKHIESVEIGENLSDQDRQQVSSQLHEKCQNAIATMEFDYSLYEASYKAGIGFNVASIIPPMELDLE